MRTYPKAAKGHFNIGLLHTSCGGYPGHATYAPCSPAELAGFGYDYWALGHVHDYREVLRDPRIIYPGNLQGRSVRECGAKGAVFVDVEDGAVVAVRRVIVDRARWAEVLVDMSGLETETQALREIETAMHAHVLAAEGRLVAVRVVLTGASALHTAIHGDAQRWHMEVEAAGQRLHEDVWLERLQVSTQPLAARALEGPMAFDLAPILDTLMADAEIRSTITAELDQMERGQRFDDVGALIEEARALLLARAAPGGR